MDTTSANSRPSLQAALLSGLGMIAGVSLLMWLTGTATGQFALLLPGSARACWLAYVLP